MRFSTIILLIACLGMVFATDFIPSGDINGKGIYAIKNFTTINASTFNGNVAWSYLTGFPANCSTGYVMYGVGPTLACVATSSFVPNETDPIWTAQKVNYTLLADLVSLVGNWSADKPNYYTKSQTEGLQNLTYYTTTSNLPVYNNGTLGSAENATINALVTSNNTTNLRINSLNGSKSGIGDCPTGQAVQNLTNGTPQCAIVQSGYQKNASGWTLDTVLQNSTLIPVINANGNVTSVNINGTLNATVLTGKLDYTYVQNPPWLTSFTETDPIWTAQKVNYTTTANLPVYNNLSSAYVEALGNLTNYYNKTSMPPSIVNLTRGFGFNLTGTNISSNQSLDINSTIFQRRIGANCTTGIGYIDEDGTVHCSAAQGNDTARIDALNTSSAILQLYSSVQRDPQGFPDEDNTNANLHSTLNFNPSTRNFSITGVSGNFSYYLGGLNVSASQKSIIISNTSGAHILYIAPNGSMINTNLLTTDILCSNVIVGIVVWDAPKGIQYIVEDERHTRYMGCLIHDYLHEHLGTQYDNGLNPQLVIAGSSTPNSSAYLNTTAGAISDEDYTHNIVGFNGTLGGRYRVFYQIGQTGNWSIKEADEFPFIWNDVKTFNGTGGRIAYNLNTGGVWSLATASSTNIVLAHIFATNSFNSTNDMIIIEGQNQYTTAALATTGATTEIANILTSGLFGAEFKPIATILVQTNTSWANAPHAIFVAPNTGGSYIDWRTAKLNGVSGTASSGTVTLINTGTGLTGGPITNSGTLSIDDTYIQNFNATAMVNSLNATKAAIGTATCAAGYIVQNVTLSNTSVTTQCVSVGAVSEPTQFTNMTTSQNTSNWVSANSTCVIIKGSTSTFYIC